MDFFEFGTNAENLPDDPNLIENGKTYKSDPTDQFMDYGFESNSVVESSQFNGYIIYLINLIKLIVPGIRKIMGTPPTTWKKNDLRINRSRDLEICDGEKWYPISFEATETIEGYIDKDKLLTDKSVKLIPIATETKEGSILKSDKVTLDKYKFMRDSYHYVYHDIDTSATISPFGSYELINIKKRKDLITDMYNNVVILDLYDSGNDIYSEFIILKVQGMIILVE